MADLLADMENGAELTGLFAYLSVDDKARASWSAYATAKAFGGDRQTQRHKQAIDDDEEEVIDTTKPEFAKNFKGFTHTKPQAPQQGQQRQIGTQILLG